MKYFTLLIGIFIYASANAQVFRCVDSNGKTTYSDSECTGKNKHVKTIEQDANVVAFEDHVKLDENKLKILYTGNKTGLKSRFLRVSIYEETESYIIFYVEGYYNGPSNGKAEFRVLPNIHWGSNSFSTSDKGISSGYARVGLGSKEKGTAVSDIITLQLWYYSPQNKASVLETKVIPYKKKWVKDIQ